ncbi:NAD(P)H-dependent oxidoreductase [Amorphus sp. MBR-141]
MIAAAGHDQASGGGSGRVVAFCGTSWRPAKARLLVEAVARDLYHRHGLEAEILDLVDAGPGIAAFTRAALGAEALRVVEAIEQADALIIGSPVFQGSYPGLFKHVFDLIAPGALKNCPVLLTACGGGLRHSLMVEHQLRPLFGFFEASTVSTAVYAGAVDFVDGRLETPAMHARIADAVDQFAALLTRRHAAAA